MKNLFFKKSNSFAGVWFHNCTNDGNFTIPGQITYDLKLNSSQAFLYNAPSVNNFYYQLNNFTQISANVHSGLLPLQREVSVAILDYLAEKSNIVPKPNFGKLDISVSSYPIRPYKFDLFSDVFKAAGPLLLISGFVSLSARLVASLVQEKEEKTKEGMKMMGLSESVFWFSWWATYSLLSLIPIAIVLIMWAAAGLMEGSFIWLFIPMFLYVQSLITYGFCLVPFFDTSKLAGQVGGIFMFLLFLPQYALGSNTPLGAYIGASFSSPIAFSQAAMELSLGMVSNEPISMHNQHGPGVMGYNLACWMLFIDFVLYGILAWYFSHVIPSEYGVRYSWYFFLTKEYWFASETSEAMGNEEREELMGLLERNYHDEESYEPIEEILKGKESIIVHGLKKVFESETGPVHAVDGLSLTMYKGQIFALLGHNGAGKSTTISILTGLIEASMGEARINGFNAFTQMHMIRQSLGVCPQHDILFENLDVVEHLKFYGSLKGLFGEELLVSMERLIHDLGLAGQENVMANHLSGGQKRKLSVAIALIGDPDVLFMDEPTSGMDPYSRRQVWDVLKAEKLKGKCIILTTHYMDEADLLGDRIGVMSHGKLQCVGSSLFLKKRFGIGYHLNILLTSEDRHERKIVKEVVSELVETAKISSEAGKELSYLLSLDEQESFPALFAKLGSDTYKDQIQDFGISLTTLEEVFLSLAEISEKEEKNKDRPQQRGLSIQVEEQNHDLTPLLSEEKSSSMIYKGHDYSSLLNYTIEQSVPNFLQQFNAGLRKRFYNYWRERRALVFQLFLPVLYVFMAVMTAQGSVEISSGTVHPYEWGNHAEYYVSMPTYIAAPTAQDRQEAHDYLAYMRFDSGAKFNSLNSSANLTSMNSWGRELIKDSTPASYLSVISATPWRLNFSNQPLNNIATKFNIATNSSTTHLAPTVLNNIYNTIAETIDSGFSLQGNNVPYHKAVSLDSGQGMNLALWLGLALNFIPVGFGVNVVVEKKLKSKHQQLIMGMNAIAYWGSTLLADFSIFCIPAVAVFIMFMFFPSLSPIIMGLNFFPTITLFILYCLSASGYMYFFTFLFDEPQSFQALAVISSIFVGMAGFFLSFFMSPNYPWIPWVFSWLPAFNIMEGLNQLTNLNTLRTELNCGSQHKLIDFDQCHWSAGFSYDYGIGQTIIASVGCIVVYFVGAYMAEVGFFDLLAYPVEELRGTGQILNELETDRHPEERIKNLEEDVKNERDRVLEGKQEKEDFVTINEMVKIYPSKDGDGYKYAVRGVTFGVPEGQCFGLLGPNGAGKTSLIKILVNDVLPNGGSGNILGYDVVTQKMDVFHRLGFCPQFDGLMPKLTGREHLRFYCDVKGIPLTLQESIVADLLTLLDLNEFADRPSKEYSGGNMRKLNVAISLVGKPGCILLDEPSTGMDPGTRRKLWYAIQQDMTGRACILTTHSMEEAEALCDNIGIMVNGELVALGSSQHLKSKFGAGYQIELKTKESKESVDRVKEFIQKEIPYSNLKEEFGGRMRYECLFGDLGLGELFELMETNKDVLKLSDYSLSQPTLEQVFLKFASAQEDEE